MIGSVLGAGFGLGVFYLATGLRPVASVTTARRWRLPRLGQPVRWGYAIAAAALLGLLTGWPVAALAGGLLGFHAQRLLAAGQVGSKTELDKVRAIRGWIEMLRNTLVAAHSLEKAIAETAKRAPVAIRPTIERLHTRAEAVGLVPALVQAADELEDQSADLAVVGLAVAAEGSGGHLAGPLEKIAEATKARVALQQETESDRAGRRTSIRIVIATPLVFVLGGSVLSRSYFEPFAAPQGQFVLLLIVGLFVGAFAWVARISRVREPDRLLTAGAVFAGSEGECEW